MYVTNTIIDNKRYLSLTNVGFNPTVSKTQNIKVETHVLDFEKEAYGKEITVEFVDFIRDEKKFVNLQELKSQINKDIEYVKALFCKASI